MFACVAPASQRAGGRTTLQNMFCHWGFEQGQGHPAVFVHRRNGLLTVVHGDDYVSSATGCELDWLEAELGKRYAIKTQRLRRPGTGEGDCEVKGLNRVVRCTSLGYDFEADPRHAELVVQQTLASPGRAAVTPGLDEKEKEEEEDKALQGDSVKLFRSIAARCNYLSQDKPELRFPVQEICKEMASPTAGSWRQLVRIAEFLKGRPRLVWCYASQDPLDHVDVLGDAN